MKKIISVFLAAVTVFALFSCGDRKINADTTAADSGETENETGFKPYKLGIVGGDYIFADDPCGGYPVKYNVHNGQMSYLCPDPFCSHELDECEFSGVGYTSIGNTVYFAREDEATGKCSLYAFDADTSELKIIYSSNAYLSVYRAYDYRLLMRYSSGFGKNAYGYYFWYDTKTGDIEEIDEGKVPGYHIIYDITDGRIIWRKLNSDEYVSTDLQFGDLKEHDFGYRYGNHYEFVQTDGIYSLYVTFKGDDEKTLLLEDVGPYLFYENKIIYFKVLPLEEQPVVHICEDGTKDTDEFGGNVYVMNPDGSDNHLLLHTDKMIMGTTTDRMHPQVCGDYFALIVARYEGDGICDDTLLIANINTGEYVITTPLY